MDIPITNIGIKRIHPVLQKTLCRRQQNNYCLPELQVRAILVRLWKTASVCVMQLMPGKFQVQQCMFPAHSFNMSLIPEKN